MSKDDKVGTKIVLRTMCGCESPPISGGFGRFLQRFYVPLFPRPSLQDLDSTMDQLEAFKLGYGVREFKYSGEESRWVDEHGNKMVTLYYDEVMGAQDGS